MPKTMPSEMQDFKTLLKAAVIFIAIFGLPGILISRVSQIFDNPPVTHHQNQ